MSILDGDDVKRPPPPGTPLPRLCEQGPILGMPEKAEEHFSLSSPQNWEAGKISCAAQRITPHREVAGRFWWDCACAVLQKDLRMEGRTRYAAGVTLLFAVCTVAGLSAVLSGSAVHADAKAALLWIVLLFAGLSGLARTFVREEEAGTAAALRLTAPPTAVFVGKLAFNALLMAATETVTVPLFLAVLPPPQVNFGLLLGVLVLGGFGLASASTFAAALIAQAGGGRSALFFVVAFPVLLPLLLMAAQATVGAFSDAPFFVGRAWNELGLLAAYSTVVTTAALLLFGMVWRDE